VGGFLVYNPQCLSTKANTWPEVMEYVRSSDVPKAYLPVGSVEAHGPHLPLDTDTIIAEYIARSVCNKIGGFLLPPINYGVLWALRPYPGSVHVEDEVLEELILNIGDSLSKQGFKLLVIVNAHMVNQDAIRIASRKLYGKLSVLYFNPDIIGKIASKHVDAKPLYGMFHADEIETSILLHINPQLVHLDRVIKEELHSEMGELIAHMPLQWGKFVKMGVLGDPTKASEKKGREILDEIVQYALNIVEKASALLRGSL
jgi:creatinine amidohydrolase